MQALIDEKTTVAIVDYEKRSLVAFFFHAYQRRFSPEVVALLFAL